MKMEKVWYLSFATFLSLITVGAHAQQMKDEVVWPDIPNSYQSEGDFIQPESVRRVKPQVVTKDETRLLLGNPHFTEGYFGVREWNYIFNFYTGKGSDYVTCQYQVHFDKNWIVDRTSWKDEQCERLIVREATPDVKHAIVLEADGMFAFAKSGLNDLQPKGREKLENLARQIQTGYADVKSVSVVGYTDRIGSLSDNMALSLARANTVKAFFVSKGISERIIRTQGLGSENPVTTCVGPTTAATIACLSPNRRVVVSVDGTAK